jgi:hypothetical protein
MSHLKHTTKQSFPLLPLLFLSLSLLTIPQRDDARLAI